MDVLDPNGGPFFHSKLRIVEDSLSPSNPVFTFAPSSPLLLHIFPSIQPPLPVLTRRIACLFTEKVNFGMNVRVAVRVTFPASFPLLSSVLLPTLPPPPVTRVVSPAPWLCASNERSRHALSGLRPWKAVRHSEVK